MKYSLNLVREIRIQERKNKILRTKVIIFTIFCFSLLIVSIGFSVYTVLGMKKILKYEEGRLLRINNEYKRYKKTDMIVSKADVEHLNRLQNKRIFWTKKLASTAHYLPKNYWITELRYVEKKKSFDVKGYGYITNNQKQLITLDQYLNNLRNDKNFSDVFNEVYFNETSRKDEKHRKRVSFSFSAIGSK